MSDDRQLNETELAAQSEELPGGSRTTGATRRSSSSEEGAAPARRSQTFAEGLPDQRQKRAFNLYCTTRTTASTLPLPLVSFPDQPRIAATLGRWCSHRRKPSCFFTGSVKGLGAALLGRHKEHDGTHHPRPHDHDRASDEEHEPRQLRARTLMQGQQRARRHSGCGMASCKLPERGRRHSGCGMASCKLSEAEPPPSATGLSRASTIGHVFGRSGSSAVLPPPPAGGPGSSERLAQALEGVAERMRALEEQNVLAGPAALEQLLDRKLEEQRRRSEAAQLEQTDGLGQAIAAAVAQQQQQQQRAKEQSREQSRGISQLASALAKLELRMAQSGGGGGAGWSKWPPWQCARLLRLLRARLLVPCSSALPGLAPAPRVLATASNARADRLQSRPFHCVCPCRRRHLTGQSRRAPAARAGRVERG